MAAWILSCESTVDLPYRDMEQRNIPVLFYSYVVDGTAYLDDMGRDPAALPRFYQFLEEGKAPSTSQLNTFQYLDFFEPLLQQGDVLHIGFGTGMTPSVKNAEEAAQSLREKYPERKITVIDSLCSSSGYGMLVDSAADLRDAGVPMGEVAQWVLEKRHCVHHQFYSTDLKYYRRSGRISGPAAAIGAILNICPIMRLDDKGRIIAYGKVRGQAAAIRKTLDTMQEHAENGADYAGKCYICHSNCLPAAERLRDALLERFPKLKAEAIKLCDIGTIIAAHCGPGTLAVFFYGDPRAPYTGSQAK